jgi:nitrite reductase/ring-hydroxylating ferredoxin subunit
VSGGNGASAGGSERHRVCALDELTEPGSRVLAEVRGIPIGVFRLSDGLYALENRCPHQGGPVCDGELFRRLVAEVDEDSGRVREFYASEEHDVIACPLHGWEMDIRTGQVLADSHRRAISLPVHVEDDTVFVEIPEKMKGGRLDVGRTPAAKS